MKAPVLAALAVTLIATAVQAKTVTFRWETVPGAKSYEIQVATDMAFKNVTTSEKTKDTYFRGDIPETIHFWRVRAIDVDGVPGVFSPPRFIHGTVPSPTLTGPAANTRIKHPAAPAIDLTWKGSPLIARYIVEIGRNADLAQPLKTKKTSATQYRYTHKGAGTYYWRVSALDLNGDRVEPSATRSFEVLSKAVARRTPTPAPTQTPAPAATPVATPEPARTLVVDAGAGLGVFSNFGGFTAARPKLEVGVQPWKSRPVRLSLEAAFLSTSTTVEDATGSLDGSSRLQAYPVSVNVTLTRPWRRYELYGTAGLFVTPMTATVAVPTQPEFRESSVSGGACLMVGAERRGLFAELGYGVGTPVNGLVRASPNGLVLSVGYRMAVWPR